MARSLKTKGAPADAPPSTTTAGVSPGTPTAATPTWGGPGATTPARTTPRGPAAGIGSPIYEELVAELGDPVA